MTFTIEELEILVEETKFDNNRIIIYNNGTFFRVLKCLEGHSEPTYTLATLRIVRNSCAGNKQCAHGLIENQIISLILNNINFWYEKTLNSENGNISSDQKKVYKQIITVACQVITNFCGCDIECIDYFWLHCNESVLTQIVVSSISIESSSALAAILACIYYCIRDDNTLSILRRKEIVTCK